LATGEFPGLHASLVRAMTLWKSFLLNNPILFPVIKQYSLGPPADFLAFLVDHTATCYIPCPDTWIIISEKLCYMTRTWLFQMHKERLKLLQLWN
jgi:hypothetical protein